MVYSVQSSVFGERHRVWSMVASCLELERVLCGVCGADMISRCMGTSVYDALMHLDIISAPQTPHNTLSSSKKRSRHHRTLSRTV